MVYQDELQRAFGARVVVELRDAACTPWHADLLPGFCHAFATAVWFLVVSSGVQRRERVAEKAGFSTENDTRARRAANLAEIP